MRASKSTIPDTEVTLSDLIEGANYEFRVSAENEAGVGPPCKPIGPVEIKEPTGLQICIFKIYSQHFYCFVAINAQIW